MRTFIITLLLGMGLAGFISTSNASPFNNKIILTFNNRVEIPGMVLAPGKYVVERTIPRSNPDILTIWNAEQTHAYATVKAVPVSRETPAKNVIVTFAERSGHAPMALKTLFYPGDRVGEEFIYRTTAVARVSNLPTPTVSGPVIDPFAPAVWRNDWNNSLESDLGYRQLMAMFENPVSRGE